MSMEIFEDYNCPINGDCLCESAEDYAYTISKQKDEIIKYLEEENKKLKKQLKDAEIELASINNDYHSTEYMRSNISNYFNKYPKE